MQKKEVILRLLANAVQVPNKDNNFHRENGWPSRLMDFGIFSLDHWFIRPGLTVITI